VDRLEFTNSLKCGEHINSSFDEFMIIYDLISPYDMLKVDSYDIIDDNKILFNISITSPNISINDIKNIIETTVIDKYSYRFKAKICNISEDKLNIILYKQRVSG
jgi:hypothetical protein